MRVLAVTKDGVRELPLPQIDTPGGRSLAFPVAVDIDGDGRAEAVGVRRGPTGLSVVIVARA